jgi:hypothetical protein
MKTGQDNAVPNLVRIEAEGQTESDAQEEHLIASSGRLLLTNDAI